MRCPRVNAIHKIKGHPNQPIPNINYTIISKIQLEEVNPKFIVLLQILSFAKQEK